MPALMEMARDLGREIGRTDEFQRLTSAEEGLKADLEAMKLMKDVRETQEKLSSLQSAGLEASEEQVDDLKEKSEKMSRHPAVTRFFEAQKEFDAILQSVNGAISDGMRGEGGDE